MATNEQKIRSIYVLRGEETVTGETILEQFTEETELTEFVENHSIEGTWCLVDEDIYEMHCALWGEDDIEEEDDDLIDKAIETGEVFPYNNFFQDSFID